MLGDGQGAFVVVQSCDSNSTFKVVGSEAIFIGLGDKYEGECVASRCFVLARMDRS